MHHLLAKSALLAALLLSPRAAAAAAAVARATLPFGFGWRHFLGDPNSAPCPDPSTYFPLNLSDVQCSGLSAVDAALTPAACAAAACGKGAVAWQFCTTGHLTCGAADCWAGTPNAPCAGRSARWVGAGRTPPPAPPVPPPAQPAFDDAAWEVVDAPHDSLITTPYSNMSSNSQGSIPKSVGWYRKHFALPASWASSHVEVYFEGAFSVVSVWLNGQPVTNHSCGYTSFSARLDNITGVVWGGENVLAVYTDSTVTTGWWCVCPLNVWRP